MNEKKITCIICPLGCEITVLGVDKTVISIEGHGCKRGQNYAAVEFSTPKRIFTSSVKVRGAYQPLVSVRSRDPVPKELLLECVTQLRGIELEAPVNLYDVVVSDILGTGVDIIATAAVLLCV